MDWKILLEGSKDLSTAALAPGGNPIYCAYCCYPCNGPPAGMEGGLKKGITDIQEVYVATLDSVGELYYSEKTRG